MPLAEGIYEIRFVPKHLEPPFLGGVYATGEHVNAPIRAEPLAHHGHHHHHHHEHQKWKVQVISAKDNLYKISLPGFKPPPNINLGPGPVIPGFGLRANPNTHKELVILTVDIQEWIIEISDEKNLIGSIILPTKLIGARQAINEEHHILYLQSYPVIEHAPPLPRWEFVPVKQ